MAYDGLEVEIKVKADDATAKAIRQTLLKNDGVTQKHHIDAYFDNPLKSFLKERPISEWLSVRHRGDKVIMNHKRWQFDKDGRSSHAEESELLVDNVEDGIRFLASLGFEPLVVVNKHRTEGLIEGMMVSVDEVAELGFFIEIEANESLGTIEETRKALMDLAVKLGLKPTAADRKGYPHLLLEKQLGHELIV